MRRIEGAAAGALAVVLVLAAPRAGAQEPPADAAAAPPREWSCADQEPILDEARVLAESDLPRALDTWESIVRRCGEGASLRALYNVGWGHKKLGHANPAMASYLRFVQLAEPLRGQSEEHDRFLRNAKSAIGELRAQNGELVVAAMLGHDVRVEIDGAPGPAVPFRWLLSPGRHAVRVRVDGTVMQLVRLDVRPGATHPISARAPEGPTPLPPPQPFPVVRIALLWGGAAVAGGLGAVAHVLAAGYASDANELAAAGAPTDEQKKEHSRLADRNTGFSVAAVAGYGLGAVLGAIALTSTVIASGESQRPKSGSRWPGLARGTF